MKQWLHKRPMRPMQKPMPREMELPSGISNQAMLSMLESQGMQTAPRPASGGTPLDEAMRVKFERQFGLPMGDVRVHHNSDEPDKFGAGAYTYGTDIFIRPGQEKLLNHEMTHVAQQKLGQVGPTGIEHGMAVNRSPVLEHSADMGTVPQVVGGASGKVVQCGDDDDDKEEVVKEPPRKRHEAERPARITKPVAEEAKAPTEDATRFQADLAVFNRWKENAREDSDLTRVLSAFDLESLSGVSLNEEGKIGSIYFGGTQSKHSFSDEELNRVKQFRRLSRLPDGPIKNQLIAAMGGGRLRLLHQDGPRISRHEKILRTTKEDALFELFADEDDFGYHQSRGSFNSIHEYSELKLDGGMLSDLIYVVAYAEKILSEGQRQAEAVYEDAICRANSFVAHYVAQHLPALYSNLNMKDVRLDYYGPVPEQRRRS